MVGEGEGLGLAAGVDEDYWGLGVEVSGADFADEGGHRFAGVVGVEDDAFGFGDEVDRFEGGFGGDAVGGAGISGDGVDVAGFEGGVESEEFGDAG